MQASLNQPTNDATGASPIGQVEQDDDQTFTLTTIGQPSRTYTSIAHARSDGNNARVWGGMHYPSTVGISDAEGEAIASYVNQSSMKRLHGGNDHDGR